MEENLIQRVLRRDEAAIAALYDTFAPKFLSICFRYCGNREDAEDVLHDGFIRILQNLQTFKVRSDCGFEAWMKRIIINTTLNFLRSRIKTSRHEDIDPLVGKLDLGHEESEDPSLYHQVGQEQIMQWISDLPIGYRTVFNLHVFEQYGHKEIAEILNISESTSKTQLFKARNLLRKKLDQKVRQEKTLTYGETGISIG